MNRQPFQTPPQWWEPKMSPWLVKLWRPLINRTLVRRQRMTHLEVQNISPVQQAIRSGAGVLVAANHSFHYDSYVMIEAAHRVGRPFHFLTAWQVFAMSKRFERWMLQRHGCYSINREGNDVQAFKRSVDILRDGRFPLVVFPEGDIYHNNDLVTPFRDGAAAIAMSAAKKGPRPVVIVPCALKSFYVQDPTKDLESLMARLEAALHWRPRPHLPLAERIYKFAEGLLTLKEIEYRGRPYRGSLSSRSAGLADAVLQPLEAEYGLNGKGAIVPERVKEVRRAIIRTLEQNALSLDARRKLADDLEDLFFVIQLFSYPGDYLSERPSIERIAETLDKFEEDVLQADVPGIRGERIVIVRFGTPLEVPRERDSRDAVARWTDLLERKVQDLLDEINAARSNGKAAKAALNPPSANHTRP